jgi:uncharacterized protein (DUF952 family)
VVDLMFKSCSQEGASTGTGEIFPHLYGTLHMRHVLWAETVALGDDGVHVLPPRLTQI